MFLFSDGENISAELDDRTREALTEGLDTGRIEAFVCVELPGAGGTNTLDRLTESVSEANGPVQTVSIRNFQPEEYIRLKDRAPPRLPSCPCPYCGSDLYDFVGVDEEISDLKFCPSCGVKI